MSDQRPGNPFDAMRRVINHEANQDDDGGFFAKLGGIEPEHDDAPTAKGLFQHMDFNQPGTPVYAAKPGETYTPRNQPEHFYRGHIRDDGTHDVYRIPMTHISKDNPPSEYIGNFTKEQIQNGDHR